MARSTGLTTETMGFLKEGRVDEVLGAAPGFGATFT